MRCFRVGYSRSAQSNLSVVFGRFIRTVLVFIAKKANTVNTANKEGSVVHVMGSHDSPVTNHPNVPLSVIALGRFIATMLTMPSQPTKPTWPTKNRLTITWVVGGRP